MTEAQRAQQTLDRLRDEGYPKLTTLLRAARANPSTRASVWWEEALEALSEDAALLAGADALREQQDAAQTIARLTLERDSAKEQFDRHVEWAAAERAAPAGLANDIETRFALMITGELHRDDSKIAKNTLRKVLDALLKSAEGKDGQ